MGDTLSAKNCKKIFKYIPRGLPRAQSNEGLLGERDAGLSPNRARGFIPRAKYNYVESSAH
jgi:hypothetical protein